MRLPVVRGRDIAESDTLDAPGVVLINERAARRYWPGEDPLGKRISFGTAEGGKPQWVIIAGVVKDAKQESWADEPEPETYLAAFQHRAFLGDSAPHFSYLTLVVRTVGNPAALAPAVKETVWRFDRNLPISEVATMDQVVADATAEPRFEMLLLGMFAAVALALAAVGIYGVMSYAVSRRTHEIGIRVSLGASRAGVLWMVLRQGMALAAAGAVAGGAGALLLSRLMTKLLYAVKPTDPVTFVAGVAVLGLVALVATYIPAWRATRIDPVSALRCE
jgi:predicted permease